jgi:flagellar hook-associated protein 1
MSLNSIMNIGVSGLMTAQEQLRVTSDNISNVNTPGYIRKQANQTSVTIGGKGAGVSSGQITLAADRYLQQASFKAASEASQSGATYDLLDQIQAQFGDITDENNLFNQMNSALTSMAKAGETPSSSALRQEVVSNLSGFLAEGARISDKIQQVRADADARIASDVTAINDLLKNISKLNASISSATVVGGDATGAQSAQTGYVDQLSKLIDVKVTQNDNGGVTVRTQNGTVLSGDTYATLSYQPTSNVSGSTVFNSIMIKGVSGETRDFGDSITSGELKGLIDMRDTTAPAINDQLNQYMAKFAEQMNAAHNDSSAVPAPTSLTGKGLSQSQSEALNGMSGITNIVMLDSNGAIASRMEIDFTANTWTRYPAGGGSTSGTFADATFAADIQTGSAGGLTLAFTGGALSINAAGTTAGVAVADPATGGSDKLGQGFSQYFGLNDIISSKMPTSNQTGLTAASAHGFTGGSQISFSIKGENGSALADIDFTIPTTGVTTLDDLRVALNDTTNGVGRYGTFSLDSTTGALTFSGYGSPAATLGVSSDNTSRLGGASFSTFFGIGGTSGKVASGLAVHSTINGNPAKMALAHVDLSATSPSPALVSGDGAGGLAMSDIANTSITFPRSGLNGGGTSTLERYASDLAGQVGNLAANAETNKTASEALLKEATNRRSATEGVNLDEELINLTVYQQAYSASGRLIQAVKEMYDVLLSMGR